MPSLNDSFVVAIILQINLNYNTNFLFIINMHYIGWSINTVIPAGCDEAHLPSGPSANSVPINWIDWWRTKFRPGHADWFLLKS